MRLTLRTMLAWMDEILEPSDREDLGKKIDDSQFATTLVHRIRDVMRRIRLGAPATLGKGPGSDPNTVAEYLDNTLPAERVPDFEKVCLESDAHLAEVASCHQILTIVLGEPAEVDPESRRRMYGIAAKGHAIDDEPTDELVLSAPLINTVATASMDAAPVNGKSRPKREVPAYLRETARSRSWIAVAAVLLVAVLGGVLVMAMGPLDHTHPLAKMLGLGPAAPGPVAQVAKQPAGVIPAENNAGPGPLGDELGKPPAGVGADENVVGSAPVLDPGVNDSVAKSQAGVADEKAVGRGPNADVVQPPVAADPDVVKPQAGPNVDEKVVAPVDAAKPPAGMNADEKVVPAPAKPGEMLAPGEVRPGDAAPVAVAVATVGRFASDDSVLVRFDPKAGNWQRVAGRATLAAGDRLLALPTFRPTIILSEGVTVQMLPETLVELVGPDAEGVAGIEMPYGRLVLMTAGKAGTRLRLLLGDREGMLTFGDAESVVAVEVRRYNPAGIDPERAPSPVAIDLYAGSGQIHWSSGPQGTPEILGAPRRLVIAPHAGELEPVSNELPQWISEDKLSPLDKRASLTLYQRLEDDKPVALTLRELVEDRRVENRSLAIRSLSYLSDFSAFSPLLNDPQQHASWAAYLENLQQALLRSPDTAMHVRETFLNLRGEDKGGELFRMLYGFTKEDLEGGWSRKLVDYLDHEDLDFRVLAIWNLRNITGKSLFYRPEDTAQNRKRYLAKWKEELANGLITTRAMPAKKPPASEGGPQALDAPPSGPPQAEPTR